MARISSSHVAGLDLIDKLFFNQILVHCLSTDELLWLKGLDTDLDHELTHSDVTDAQRQVVRHGVLCILEAELSDPLRTPNEIFSVKRPELPENIPIKQYEELERYLLDFYIANVIALISVSHKCEQKIIFDIAESLIKKYKKKPISAIVRCYLVEKMFSYEFVNAPIDCFTWLSKMGVLDSKKYRGDRLNSMYRPEFLERLTLLCELDLYREDTSSTFNENEYIEIYSLREIYNLPKKTKNFILSKISNSFNAIKGNTKNSIPFLAFEKLENQNSVKDFFSIMESNKNRVRVRSFQGSLGGYIGILCGGYVELLIRDSNKKESIYSAESNEGSLTDFISKWINSRGFCINARTIYERHREFKETILRITDTYRDMTKVAIPPYVEDYLYNEIICQGIKLKPKLRRNPLQ